MKMTKKCISVMLSLLLLINAVFTTSINVLAANYDTISTARSISTNATYSGNITRDDETDYYKFSLSNASELSIKLSGAIAAIQINIFDVDGNKIIDNATQWSSAHLLSFNRTIYLLKGTYYFKVNRADYNGNGSREDVEYNSYTFKLSSSSSNVTYEDVHNTIATSKTISLNTTYKGQISFNNYTDYYRFNLQSSSKITVNGSGTIGVFNAYLYSSDGTEVTNYEFRDNSSGVISYNWDIHLNKGTYYLKISKGSYNHNSLLNDREFGRYSFNITSVSANASFESDDNTLAKSNSAIIGKEYNGQIAINDITDYYKINISNSGQVGLRVTGILKNIKVIIYDAYGVEIYNKNISANSSEQILDYSNIELDTGVYYIRIEKQYSYGNYSFMVCKHSFSSKVSISPTCNNKGEKTYTCTECGYSYTERIESLGHNYQTVITPASIDGNGKVEYKCINCNDIDWSETIYRQDRFTWSNTKFVYNGKNKKQKVTVYDVNGDEIPSKYYDVIYSNNKNVGKAGFKFKFKGYYSGVTKVYYFTIVPKGTSISKITSGKKKVTVKWKKQSAQTTGYELQYSTSGSFKNAKKIVISKNTSTAKTISKLAVNKKYYVRIRTYKTVNSKKYYSSWSKSKTITTKK